MTVVVLEQNGGDDSDPPDTAVADGEPIIDNEDAHRTEQRRMWCLQQAMSVAFTAMRFAPNGPMVNITNAAEEMVEFIETGVARTHKDVPRTTQ